EAARCFDTGSPWARVATSLAKYKTAEQAVWCTRKALELVGGNGYTEEYPVARLFRDAQVLTVWEGPEQIQALELIRTLIHHDGAGAFLYRLKRIAASLPEIMKTERERLGRLTADVSIALRDLERDPDSAAIEYLDLMSEVLAYALLCEEGAWELERFNDAEKILFAERFYKNRFEIGLRPRLDVSLLEKDFGRVIEGRGFKTQQ
ncbi:MAG: acyl-CoA dehydrogenase family protein, partial [Bryobacteraceae bacterium]